MTDSRDSSATTILSPVNLMELIDDESLLQKGKKIYLKLLALVSSPKMKLTWRTMYPKQE
jgi:hypothetical protein